MLFYIVQGRLSDYEKYAYLATAYLDIYQT